MKKIILVVILTLFFCLIPLGTVIAFADGTGEDTTPTITVIDEQAAVENFFNRWIVPIASGTAGSILLVVLAFLRPYIKRVGENKTLMVAYNAARDKLSTAEQTASELKEQMKNVDLGAILQSVTKAVVTVVTENISEIIKKEIDKRSDLIGRVLANSEVISAQVGNLISAASVTWNNVDGVQKLLSTSPTSSALEKQAKSVELLKAMVAAKCGTELAEIQELLDEALDRNINQDEIMERYSKWAAEGTQNDG